MKRLLNHAVVILEFGSKSPDWHFVPKESACRTNEQCAEGVSCLATVSGQQFCERIDISKLLDGSTLRRPALRATIPRRVRNTVATIDTERPVLLQEP